MPKINKQNKLILFASLLAALLYASWVLGYIVNTPVALHGTASELAATSQPYRLVFVLGDTITCIYIVLIATWLFNQHHSSRSKLTAVCYALFGLGTALAAYTPLICSDALNSCNSGAALQRAIVHNTIGLIANIFLFLAAWSLSHKFPKQSAVFKCLILLWASGGICSVLISLLLTSSHSFVASLQRLFLVGTSVLIFWIPTALAQKTSRYAKK